MIRPQRLPLPLPRATTTAIVADSRARRRENRQREDGRPLGAYAERESGRAQPELATDDPSAK